MRARSERQPVGLRRSRSLGGLYAGAVTTIQTVEELAAIYGEPVPTSIIKELDRISDDHRQFIEAAPFVALAAAASLLLALGAWLRPRWLLLLVTIAGAMLVFAALDVREVFHQSDESRTGLAVLAGFVGLFHLGAGVVAGLMGRDTRRAPA